MPGHDPGALPREFDVLENTYRWALAKAGSPAGIFWLCLISFAESSVFPLPPDVLLVPMVLRGATNGFVSPCSAPCRRSLAAYWDTR